MRSLRSVLALTGAAAFAAASIAAAPTTDTVTTTVVGDTVTVAGTLADGLGPVVIGTDPGDDAVGSGYGHDLSEYAVSFPEDRSIAFHLTIADPNPATGHAPHGSVFEIVPTVDGTARELTATATADGGLQFGSQTCAVNPDTGVNECSTSPVEGSYEDGVLTWIVPTSATPGGQVNGGKADVNLLIGTGTTGGVTLVNGPIDTMGINAIAQLPTAELLIDGTVAGTAGLSDAGFEVSAAGLSAGDHTAALRLCSGAFDVRTNSPVECTDVDLGTVTTS